MTIAHLQDADAYRKVMERLDRAYQYEPLTELPQDFEQFFIKMTRKGGQTLQEFQGEFTRLERRLSSVHKIALPDKVLAWFYMRRSGLTPSQRQMVLTQLGEKNLTLEKMTKAMTFIMGQDYKGEAPAANSRWNKSYSKDQSYAVADEEYEEDPDVFYEDDDEDWPDEDWDESFAVEDEADAFDVEEYDDVFSAYVEAKSQLNRMRTSRGFYPVVAVVQNGAGGIGQSKGSSGGSKGKRGKGKSKSSKSRGKGQSSSPSSTGGGYAKGGAKARGRDAQGRQVCLRCGSAGHRAKNCPAGGEKKRKSEGSPDGDASRPTCHVGASMDERSMGDTSLEVFAWRLDLH